MNERGVRLLGLLLLLLLLAGNARAADQAIPLPTTLNRQDIGELNAHLRDTEVVDLEFGPLRTRLEDALSRSQFVKLPQDPAVWISPAQLEAAGVRVQFDFQSLALHLTVAPEERRTETLNLIGVPEVRANRTVLPSDFSAYVNARAGVEYVESSRIRSEGLGEPQLALEGVLNLRGWVLENDAVINPSAEKDWEKRDTRLVFDQPERRFRWTLGDLNYPVTGFQGFVPMAGLSFHRENSLQPYRVTSPLGQSAFFLKENSTVEVLVNGHPVRTMKLNAGPHQISNFPLTGGANDVVLRITDPVGRVQYINATYFYEPEALRQGETEFNYAVGVPSQPDPENPFYQYESEVAASAFHRWGLTDSLTVGVNGQATADAQQAGAQMLFSTVVGVFGLDSAGTQSRALGWSHAERLHYRYYAPSESVLRDGMLSLSLRHSSDDFTSVNPFTLAVAVDETWDWQARYSQRLSDHLSAGLGYGEQLMRGKTTSRTCSLTLSHRWRRFSTGLTVQHIEGSGRPEEWTGYFSLIVHLGKGFSTFSSYDTSRRTAQAEAQYNSPLAVNAFSGTLGLSDVAGDQSMYGHARYYGRRAELMFDQYSDPSGEHRANLNWGTALAYADGQFGISRPIEDSFAIFSSTGSLQEEGGLGVLPQAGSYAAREDWLGPAVLPHLTGHYHTRVVAEPLQSSAEFDAQEGDLLLKPTYRSGTSVRIGRPATANATATLVWTNGKPVALQSGTLAGPDGAKTEFITNREGVAYLHGLSAGTYQGTFDSHPEAPFTVEIPASQKTTVDLGTISVPTEE